MFLILEHYLEYMLIHYKSSQIPEAYAVPKR